MMHSDAPVAPLLITGAAVKPKGDIDAGDFFYLLVVRVAFGKQQFPLA